MEQLNKETLVIKEGALRGKNALEYVIWQDEGGAWYGCGTGYDRECNIWEGDGVGRFKTRQEVIDELNEQYQED